MKMLLSKEWCVRMSELEEGEIGAGNPLAIRDLWLDTLAEKFCGMLLPDGVASDACACDANYPYPRYGTNLLTVAQAKEMLGKLI